MHEGGALPSLLLPGTRQLVQVAAAPDAAGSAAAAAAQPAGPGLRLATEPGAAPGLRGKLGADSEVELFADTLALLQVGGTGRQIAGA